MGKRHSQSEGEAIDDESTRETVIRAIRRFERGLAGEVVLSVADYLRLLEIRKDLEVDEPRLVTAEWRETWPPAAANDE